MYFEWDRRKQNDAFQWRSLVLSNHLFIFIPPVSELDTRYILVRWGTCWWWWWCATIFLVNQHIFLDLMRQVAPNLKFETPRYLKVYFSFKFIVRSAPTILHTEKEDLHRLFYSIDVCRLCLVISWSNIVVNQRISSCSGYLASYDAFPSSAFSFGSRALGLPYVMGILLLWP